MADTGWILPSADESNTNWLDPDEMQTDDSSAAWTEDDGANVKQYNFGFSIPSGATIDGIEVRLSADDFYDDSASTDIKLYYNSRATAAPDTNTTSPDWTSTESERTVGGSTDLWGRGSWSDTDFSNANFAVYVEANISGFSDQAVYWLKARVHYTESAGWGHKIGGVASANIGKVNGVATANISKINGT